MDKALMLIDDIEQFRKKHNCARMVMVWCATTEVFHKPASVHQTLKDFECGLMKNDPEIAPSQIYAYAAIKERSAFANRSPQSDHRYAGAAGPGAGAQWSHLREGSNT